MLEMDEASALNSALYVGSELVKNDEVQVKLEVVVKPEPLECAVCAERSTESANICTTTTPSGTLLIDFLNKFTSCDLATNSSRQACKACLNIIVILEQAELEYLKLKESFEAIISKNPLFESETLETISNSVKVEYGDQVYREHGGDSEDEPLAVTKKKRHRKVDKRKKKVVPVTKRKPRVRKENIDVRITKRVTHAAKVVHPVLQNVKKEDSVDGSESSQQNNGLESVYKLELDGFDDDDDSDFLPDDVNGNDEELLVPLRRGRGRPKASTGPRDLQMNTDRKKDSTRTLHQCDQCDAKYTSAKRLQIHKEKHLEGKPPFICEVCGARYKHKRACDVHVAMHKGISDWKCEECNKLFPSKGALQRHNNIHTGKLNYQCDLCGKSFIHTSSFKMHKLSHSGVKPHPCDVCGLALMTRSHLKRHKRIHSGEKRHECPICGKRFSERYNLVAHSKSHEASGAPPVEAAPRRRLFRCAFCQDRFERRYMLERHVSMAHGRTLERAPATPRNTMSKLLKAQAQARATQPAPPPPLAAHPAHPAHPPPADTPASDITDTKEERSPDSRASSGISHKLLVSSSVASVVSAGSWSGAYAAEFGLRHDFPH